MSFDTARRWLGLYFLLFSAALGGYVLLFAESPLLPLSHNDAADAFKIVIPVLIGQVTVVFKWYSALQEPKTREISIPPWVIKAPPIISITLVVIATALLIAGNIEPQYNIGLSPQAYKGALTFAVTILNASTVFLVARIFPNK